jgi:hypothetical protein
VIAAACSSAPLALIRVLLLRLFEPFLFPPSLLFSTHSLLVSSRHLARHVSTGYGGQEQYGGGGGYGQQQGQYGGGYGETHY